MVAGHSVTVAGNVEAAGNEEKLWFLLPYQVSPPPPPPWVRVRVRVRVRVG